MPADNLAAEIMQIQERVEETLRKNGSTTIVDVVWLMLALVKADASNAIKTDGRFADLAETVEEISTKLDTLCAGKIRPRWQQTFADEVVKWGARAAVGLAVAIVWMAITQGWTP